MARLRYVYSVFNGDVERCVEKNRVVRDLGGGSMGREAGTNGR